MPVVAAAGGSGGGPTGLVLSEVQGVCVAFGSNPFTDTPLWTRLDEPGGRYIVSEYSIDRGRQYELDKMGTGTASVTLIDLYGDFDPTNAAGPFYGDLVPMKPAAIALRNPTTGNWRTIFRGFVKSWSYDLYQTENYNTVTLELVDGMDVLANVEMITSDGTSAVIFGDSQSGLGFGQDVVFFEDDQVQHRINQVLNQSGWSNGLREILSGNVSLRETVYSSHSTALSAIQDAADGEFPGVANFYFQKTGEATFHGRFARFRPAVAEYHIDTWKVGDMLNVAGDPTRAVIFELEYDIDAEKIINHATAMPQDIKESDMANQVVKNDASISAYGYRTISFENLLTLVDHTDGSTANAATKKFATYYVNNYKDPRVRVRGLTFRSVDPGNGYASKVWALLVGVDISDLIDLMTTHNGGGNGGFADFFYVEGIHYTVRPKSDTHLDVTLTLDVSSQGYYSSEP